MNGEDKVVVWWAKKCDEKRYPKCGGGKMAGGDEARKTSLSGWESNSQQRFSARPYTD